MCVIERPKEKVEFWEEVKNQVCERYHCIYASVEDHQIKKMFPEKHGSSNALIF